MLVPLTSTLSVYQTSSLSTCPGADPSLSIGVAMSVGVPLTTFSSERSHLPRAAAHDVVALHLAVVGREARMRVAGADTLEDPRLVGRGRDRRLDRRGGGLAVVDGGDVLRCGLGGPGDRDRGGQDVIFAGCVRAVDDDGVGARRREDRVQSVSDLDVEVGGRAHDPVDGLGQGDAVVGDG